MNPSDFPPGHRPLRNRLWNRLLAPSKRGSRGTGFTLVEVALALGLCVFALVSLVSLLPVSLDSARNAVEIARRSKAIQQVAAELSQSRFSKVVAMTSMERGFTYDGNPTTDTKEIYFRVRGSVVPSTLLPGATAPSASLARVSLTVATPSQTMAGKTAITISDMGY